MAVKACLIANPTAADVTVNAHVAAARRITKINLDDTVLADWGGWITAGCAITGQDAAGSSIEKREQVGFLFEMEEQDTA